MTTFSGMYQVESGLSRIMVSLTTLVCSRLILKLTIMTSSRRNSNYSPPRNDICGSGGDFRHEG
jgi:hypothetical protein